MGEFSLSHILLFSLILLIFFGPSRLPALGQSLGKAIRGFKDGLNDTDPKNAQTAQQQQLQQNQNQQMGQQSQQQTQNQGQNHQS